MKYTVTIPIVGYTEYYVDADDDLSIEEVTKMVRDGDLELECDRRDPIVEWDHMQNLCDPIPDGWPTELEVDE